MDENRTSLSPQKAQQDGFLSFVLAYMLSFPALLSGINSTLNFVGIRTAMDTAVMYGLLIGMTGFALFCILGKGHIYIDEIILLSFFIIAYQFSRVALAGNAQYMKHGLSDYAGNTVFVLFLYSLPAYFFIRRIHDYRILYNYLLNFSYVTVAISICIYFIFTDSFANQYMTLSYNMLLQTVMLLIHKPQKFKVLHYILTIGGCYVIALGGARGALVGLIFASLLFLFASNSSVRKKVAYIFLLAIIMLVMLFFYDEILMLLNKWLKQIGMESRTLELMFMNPDEEMFDSGRGILQKKLWGQMSFFGKGLFADRAILGGSYAHNLFVELLVDYGYVVGGLLCLVVSVLLINAIRKNKKAEWLFVVALIPTGFVMLMFSGSYLNQSPSFYALLGVCVKVWGAEKLQSHGAK